MTTFAVELNEQQLDQALSLIDQVPGRARVAINRAMRETTRWGQTQLRREMSQASGVPQKFLRQRIKTGANQKRMTAFLWAGTYPVLAEEVGLMIRVPGGAAIDPTARNLQGKAYFGGAFWATMESGHSGWFLRSAPDPSSTRTSKRWTSGRARTPGTENLPITRPTIDINPAPEALERIRAQMMGQFQTRASRLLSWELEKAAQRSGGPPA